MEAGGSFFGALAMLDDIDILQLHCVGGRLNPEPSRALPASYYGDPANAVKLAGESRCNSCLYSRKGHDKMFAENCRSMGAGVNFTEWRSDERFTVFGCISIRHWVMVAMVFLKRKTYGNAMRMV